MKTAIEILNHKFIKPEVVAQNRRNLTTLLAADSPFRAERTADVERDEARVIAEAPMKARRDEILAELKKAGVIKSQYTAGQWVRKTTRGWVKCDLIQILAELKIS